MVNSTATAVTGSITSSPYLVQGSIIPASLHIEEEGSVSLGDDFTISVRELRACIKVMRELARKEYPEDFI